MFGTQPAVEANASVDTNLTSLLKSYEDSMVQSIENANASGLQADESYNAGNMSAFQEQLQTQQTCLLAATAYGTAALVLRAKITNGGV